MKLICISLQTFSTNWITRLCRRTKLNSLRKFHDEAVINVKDSRKNDRRNHLTCILNRQTIQSYPSHIEIQICQISMLFTATMSVVHSAQLISCNSNFSLFFLHYIFVIHALRSICLPRNCCRRSEDLFVTNLICRTSFAVTQNCYLNYTKKTLLIASSI